ncbi:unnamed protein product [Rhizophagus irregularis]|nr:unnamed protein product [Rhizophagus irregularis]
MNTDNNSFDPTPGLKSSNNTYLDVNISTNNSQCTEHKAIRNNFYTTNIQEWCEYCSEISYFRQIIPNITYEHCFSKHYVHYFNKSNGIYSGWVESTLNKKPISILHLPWWDTHEQCVVCSRKLKYINQELETYCQKWCSYCFTTYIGCKYCLTTSIIFGITDQSQYEFLASIRIDSNDQRLIANYMNDDTTEGGFSIIYKAIWSDGIRDLDVAVKKLSDSQNIKYIKYVLNELKSLYHFYGAKNCIISCYSISQNTLTKEYMLIMEYAKGGSLSDYLQKYFVRITWAEKIKTLMEILLGLQVIHGSNFIHRDIHSANILLSELIWWKIGDFGLSQPANET